MSNRKGTEAERELIHLFWSQPPWVAIRVAGSGSMKYPSPDIIAGTRGRLLVIECKISRSDPIYLPEDEIGKLVDFGRRMGAEIYVAFRFNRSPWQFVQPHQLRWTDKNFIIERSTTGYNFNDIIRHGLL